MVSGSVTKHNSDCKEFVFQVSKVLHLGLSHAATTGICSFKIANMFAKFCALSILARSAVERLV
jgi:hypothetical protein